MEEPIPLPPPPPVEEEEEKDAEDGEDDVPVPIPTPSLEESAFEIYGRMRFWLFLLAALVASAVLGRVDCMLALGVGYLIHAAEEEYAANAKKNV
jgi:hypothetical protein